MDIKENCTTLAVVYNEINLNSLSETPAQRSTLNLSILLKGFIWKIDIPNTRYLHKFVN